MTPGIVLKCEAPAQPLELMIGEDDIVELVFDPAASSIGPPTQAEIPALQRLRSMDWVFRHSSHMLVVTNADHEIRWVNSTCTRITGWTLDEVRGRRPGRRVHAANIKTKKKQCD